MQHPRSLALPAAVCLLIAGACQDAPLGPRAPAPASATSSPRQVPIVAFSGRAADSVMELLEPTWYSLGPSLSAHSRADWRIRNNVPARITDDALLPSNVGAPNALLTSGGTSVPQILSHFEAFYFGRHDQTSSTPSGVEAEMTFIADQGQIRVASLTVTPDSGAAPFMTSGAIVSGGNIINCADVTAGSCNQHHLSGVLTFSSAPDCSAHASGTVGYSATISQTSLGFSQGSTTSSGQTVSSSAPISATAPACSSQSTTTGSQGTDSTTTPYGSTGGPPPAPTGPNVPTAPPPPEAPVSGAGGGFVCQRTDLYQVIGASRTLLSTTIDCYPD